MLFVLIFVALATCAGGCVARRSMTAPRATGRLVVNGPDAGTAAPTPLEVPSNASGWIVRDLPGSPREVVLGPKRFTESPTGAIAVAGERFEGNIVAAVPVAAGWVFIDDRGTVARSESFVADLQPIGSFPCGFIVAESSVGRAVIVDDTGALWATDGAIPLARLQVGEPVLDAAFFDVDHGGAVLRDGRVRLTADGGRTWSAYDLGSDVAWGTTWTSSGLLVETTRGTLVLHWSGALVSSDEEIQARGRVQLVYGLMDLENRMRAMPDQGRTFRAGPTIARCADPSGSPTPAIRHESAYRCTQPRPPRALPDVAQSSGFQGRLFSNPNTLSHARLEVRRGTAAEAWLRARWAGVDSRGSFSGAAASPGTWSTDGSGDLEYGWDVQLVAGWRDGLLVLYCDSAEHCALARGGRGTGFHPIAEPFLRVRRSTIEAGAIAFPRPDGSVFVVLNLGRGRSHREARQLPGRPTHDVTPGVGLVVERDGTVRVRRGYLEVRHAIAGVVGGRPGLGLDDGTGGLRFDPLDGSASVRLPGIDWEQVGACPPRQAPAQVLLFANARSVGVFLNDTGAADDEPLYPELMQVEMSATGSCLHSFSVLLPSETGSLAWGLVTAAPGDRFTGDLHCDRQRGALLR